ncbi:hypothetical protein ACQR1Y_19290 [Bradyrhizobium sp. HKCCYLRH3099]|uniref:hypothetical protein n=1 Tax=unclassified Bradyrhizobium TaxID=2631580 RepID=UPI003EB9F49F
MDPATLAGAAIAASLPYLISLGKEAAKGAAGAAGKSVWEWLKGRLGSDSKDVQDLEKDPDDQDNQEVLEAALKKYLRRNEGEVAALASLLQQTGHLTVTGDVTATQGAAAGRDMVGNTITISVNDPKPKSGR